MPTTPCPICTAPATGRYCEHCGAAVLPRSCHACQAPLSPVARFCHRCGTAVQRGPGAAAPAPAVRSGRLPWLVAGLLIIGGLAWIALKGINRNAPGAPDMANVGSGAASGGSQGQGSGAPPDIASMTPVERFNRLYDRIMRAAAAGDTNSARQFLPMALMAYGMLDAVDADLRYHAAVLHAGAGQDAQALALADTILAVSPDHLFGYLVRAEVASNRGDARAAAAARQAFNAVLDRELARTDRPEYRDHRAVIDEYREQQ